MRRVACGILLWTVLGAAPASAACSEADVSCLTGEAKAVDAGWTDARDAALAAIATWDGNLTDEDRESWGARLAAETAAWDRWREFRCAADGLGEADVLACRIRLGRIAAADLAARYGLGFGAYRLDVETTSDPDAPAEGTGETGEFGRCADAPPGDCDYCGVNACFEQSEAEGERRMGAELDAAFERADESGRAALRGEQAAWLAWRDLACENAAWETPNRWAHSIYAMTIAPCRIAETEGRIRRLAAYDRPGP